MKDQTDSVENVDCEEHLLVVEDSTPNRSILILLLRKLGYRVIECVDGEQAWKSLGENKHVNIVAVISDLMMPNVDGLELLGRVRDHEDYKELPFILLTGATDKDFATRAKDLGVSGYLLKPISFQKVALTIEELFPHRQVSSLIG
jgi:CheY-like chemotaxis protein